MPLSSLRRPPTLVDVGPAGYQEFTAGTIPVRGVLADEEGTLVLVEHDADSRGRSTNTSVR